MNKIISKGHEPIECTEQRIMHIIEWDAHGQDPSLRSSEALLCRGGAAQTYLSWVVPSWLGRCERSSARAADKSCTRICRSGPCGRSISRALGRLRLAQVGRGWRARFGRTPAANSLCLSCRLCSQLLCPRESQRLPSKSESRQFWLWALVLLCCQDAAGPDSLESRLQGCLASNIFSCGTTEISLH